jgi:3'(2'), 5'-bisphosphate nucleotidase
MNDLEKSCSLLEGVIEIALRAGDEIMQVYESGDFGTTGKSDNSPLTQADLRAHNAIVTGLASLTPTVPVLSEEAAQAPFSERSGWRRYWLIDPLDGTKEFLSHNGEFTVNIALIEDHEPVLGVVYAPAKDVVYWGGVKAGAFRRSRTGAPQAIVACHSAAAPIRVVGSRSHRGDSLDGVMQKLGPHELIAIGSSLKLCMVAEGQADFYPRLGPTSEWDTAAAHAVVLAAGGEVVDTSGARLRYNTKEELLNPHFLVYADRSRDWVGLVRGSNGHKL